MNKNYIALSILCVLLSVCTSISAQQTIGVENSQSVISSSTDNGDDSICFSYTIFDGEDTIYFPDSLFQNNGDGVRNMSLEAKQFEDKLLKYPGVKKDEEGNFVMPNGRVFKTIKIRKDIVPLDSLMTGVTPV